MIRDIICFPVQSGSGLRIAGIGRSPSQLSIHMTRFMTYSLVKNLSLSVNILTPSKESYTRPMTGLFALGVTIYLGTWQMYFNSTPFEEKILQFRQVWLGFNCKSYVFHMTKERAYSSHRHRNLHYKGLWRTNSNGMCCKEEFWLCDPSYSFYAM